MSDAQVIKGLPAGLSARHPACRRYGHCITSPENTASQAFHTRLGFSASEVKADYDGLDRVAFTLDLAVEPTASH